MTLSDTISKGARVITCFISPTIAWVLSTAFVYGDEYTNDIGRTGRTCLELLQQYANSAKCFYDETGILCTFSHTPQDKVLLAMFNLFGVSSNVSRQSETTT